MKRIALLLSFFLFPLVLFAQSGYKEFKWDMSSDQIRTIVPSLKKDTYSLMSGDSLALIMIYLYSSEINSTFQDPTTFANAFEVYENSSVNHWRDTDLQFIFDSSKLVGIVTYFNNAKIESVLIGKYGNGIVTSIYGAKGRIWKNDGRYIVWSIITLPDSSVGKGVEFVSYLESTWVDDLCTKAIANYRETKEDASSRLD